MTKQAEERLTCTAITLQGSASSPAQAENQERVLHEAKMLIDIPVGALEASGCLVAVVSVNLVAVVRLNLVVVVKLNLVAVVWVNLVAVVRLNLVVVVKLNLVAVVWVNLVAVVWVNLVAVVWVKCTSSPRTARPGCRTAR